MRLELVLGSLFFTTVCFSQDSLPAKQVVCHFVEEDAFTTIRSQQLPNARIEATSSIEVTYSSNFPANAKTAFEYAVQLWESKLVSTVPIRISATWSSLSGSTLAQSGTSRIYRNFTNAPYSNVWYPVALAEAIAKRELNVTSEADINVTVNSNINWYFGTDARAQSGRFDFVTVVLHEIAHGIGITSTLEVLDNGTQGQWGQNGSGYIYDVFIQDSQKRQVINTSIYSNPSTSLKTVITGGVLFFGLRDSKFANALPRIHAPTSYTEGVSISHLDESTYPVGSANSLMSPNIRSAEVNHSQGELLLNILLQMGWGVNGVSSSIILSEESLEPVLDVLIYPNPVQSQLFVAIPNQNARDVSIEILNFNGQIIEQITDSNIQSKTYEFGLETLAAGLYFVRVIDGNRITKRRIVKN